MPLRTRFAIFLAFITAVAGANRALGQAAANNRKADEEAIRKAAAQYIEAAKRGDAVALSAAWTADGDYIDIAGSKKKARVAVVEGISDTFELRDAARASADATAKRQPREITIHSSSLRFITPDVAIEDGISEVRTSADEPTTPDRYTAIWVRQNGKWLLDSLREAPAPAVEEKTASPARVDLADLAWMVGEWTGTSGKGSYTFSGKFLEDKHVLERKYSVRDGERLLVEGTQYITLVAESGEIVSHSIDSSGTRSDGIWTRDEDGTWNVASESVTAGGSTVKSTNVYVANKDGSWTWSVLDATIDGVAAPDLTLKFVPRVVKTF